MDSNTTAVLLVGGKGTRLQAVVSSAPKPLAAVGDKPFLELLVRQLRYQGVQQLVFCTGHRADQIESQFGNGEKWDVEIEYSREDRPMGTAGALLTTQRYVASSAPFLVMNGDSFVEIDLRNLLRFHQRHSGLASMAIVQVENASRYGTVQVNADTRITGFLEKTGSDAPGRINAGVYVFDKRIFDHLPQTVEGPASLEKDVFPHILNHGVYAFESKGMFIDIGTPEDYARAQEICERLNEAAFRKPQATFGER